MSIFFEIADISFELEGVQLHKVSDDIIHFFHEKQTPDYEHILCHVDFVENYSQISDGEIVLQDAYRFVLNKNGKEVRIHFANPYSNIYGIYEEISEKEIKITTHIHMINMYFIELLALEKYLLRRSAFILHSCYVGYHGEGMAFTAPSGTGKSTQGNLWEIYGNGEIINGDRSILQLKDGIWSIHSLPFCGSSFTNKNISLPLKSVIIVNRDTYDHTNTYFYEQDFPRIMNEVTVNKWNRKAIDRIVELVHQLFKSNMVMNLYCTMRPEACYCLKEYLYHD